jgi:deoxycytidylate deaminase
MIINSGIREVVYDAEYEFGREIKGLFHRAGVKFRRYKRKNI